MYFCTSQGSLDFASLNNKKDITLGNAKAIMFAFVRSTF